MSQGIPMKTFPLALLALLCLRTFASDKPNIIFIMSDDHTAQAIGAYNSRLAILNPTPVLDSIAKEGAVLTNAFCGNSICTPSRASIMTGQYSHTNGVIDLGGNLPSKKQYLAHEMDSRADPQSLYREH